MRFSLQEVWRPPTIPGLLAVFVRTKLDNEADLNGTGEPLATPGPEGFFSENDDDVELALHATSVPDAAR